MFNEVRIDELVEKIRAAKKGYYLGKPIMSDPEYDALERELRELDSSHPELSEVGAEIEESSFEKVEHGVPMLSLNKAYTIEEVLGWVPADEGVGMPKMDGFAVALHYQKSGDSYLFVQGLTRGKGMRGEDVTQNLKQVKDIPYAIPVEKVPYEVLKFEVRGEVYMKKSTFKALGLDEVYENCRNIAPGSVRQKSPRVTRERKLNFFAYNVLGFESFDEGTTMMGRFSIIQGMGIPQVDHAKVILKDKNSLEAVFNGYQQMREACDYDMDGVVFCVNDCRLQKSLGNTSHHPRGFIAWKFESEEAETTLTEVQWQVSRTGLVNPVGIYNSVFIEGANLTNATLHNLSEIERLGLAVGDRIIVSRRGGVIPKIERVVKSNGGTFEIPQVCPECGKATEIRESNDGAKTLWCTNLDCPAVTMTKILHFIKVMEIDDIAEGMVTKLMDAGLIETPVDLFHLTREQFLSLPSVGARTADRAIKNINLARKRPLATFLTSLGIHTLGRSVGQSLASTFSTIEAVMTATAQDFAGIEGIGPEMSKYIAEGLKKNALLIHKLRSEIEIVEKKKAQGSSDLPLAGKSFLITGTLSVKRKEFEGLIVDHGGEIRSSVSKTLDYLIVGDSPGSKLNKAKKTGTVKIITEDEFYNLIG